MRPELETYEYIDRYLNGELTNDEQVAFEQRMAEDAGFAETVEEQKLTNDVIFQKGQINLKNQIRKDLRNRYHTSGGSSNLSKGLIGGGALIALLAGGYFFFTNGQQDLPSDMHENSKEKPRQEIARKDKQGTKSTSPSEVQDKAASRNQGNEKSSDNTQPRKQEPAVASAGHPGTPDHNRTTPADTAGTGNNRNQSVNKDTTNTEKTIGHTTDSSATHTPSLEDKQKASVESTKGEDSTIKPCDTVKLRTEVVTRGSCPDKADGKITFRKKSDSHGHGTLLYSINDGESFHEKQRFTGLKPGAYKVAVRDQKNCTSQWIVKVGIRRCTQSYSFNAALGETWEFPLNDGQDARIQIVNREGRTVYQKQISNGYPESWDGNGSNGSPLKSGNYIFIIKYDNGKTKRGNVTLIR